MRILGSERYPLRLAAFFVVLFLSAPSQAALLTDFRFWSAPDHTRVVFDLTDAAQFETSSQESPPQSHVDLRGVTLYGKKKALEVGDEYLSRVTLTQLGSGRLKLTFHQKKPLSLHAFLLKPYLDKPHRLVVDVIDPAQEKKEQEERRKQKEIKTKANRTVVIDPGHGGEDPGAIGPQKTLEKNIVLAVGKKVVQLLGQHSEIRPFLTRKGDYFIPLEERVKTAREYGADLFVSLHTDGNLNPSVRGASVYCLSLSGATDEAAKILADKENMSNVLGGAVLRPASLSKDPNVNQILLDLMMNNSMKGSFRFSETLLGDLKDMYRLKYATYRQANFVVLRSPDTPSVLLEMAYITNREDERLLAQPEFQEKMAGVIASSITAYFKESM